ncbi:uncharacterized protein [Arachis hypogaea]|uniref:uncharacterized protein n=1 Tax=Arachis hypogaea TaxID=3818 RepID=UPI0010FC5707|nr:uncharacterized protein LOC112803559 [Arachis hypogaea]
MTKTIEALKSGEISSGRGLNQETALKRAGDTRWDSHYGTILRLISLFPSVVNVLEYVEEDGNNSEQRAEACHLLNVIQSFEFIFNLHLMKNILGVTNELSQALQRNDQDIVNAMALVKVSKQRLQNIRDDEVNTELLLCITCLNPRHSFFAFDKEKLIQLAQFYPLEFSSTQLLALDSQLENFILDVRSDDHFSDLNGIGALSQKLVETRKNIMDESQSNSQLQDNAAQDSQTGSSRAAYFLNPGFFYSEGFVEKANILMSLLDLFDIDTFCDDSVAAIKEIQLYRDRKVLEGKVL